MTSRIPATAFDLRYYVTVTSQLPRRYKTERMSGFASLSTFVYVVMVLRATRGQNAANFRFPCGPQDCADAECWNDKREWPTLNHPVSEPFFPNSKQGESKEAICDHLQAATLVVRRFGDIPSISFDRTWQDYENGFGIQGNHWLGLKHIHRLSSRSKQMISLIYRTQHGNKSHMLYGTWDGFEVDSADNFYTLSLGSSQLNIDVMQSAKGQPFYTRDKVTTPGTLRCGSRFSGGWWFGNCSGRRSGLINLNGQFNATDTDKSVFVGSHVVLSAEIGMHPLHYTRSKYTCDNTCPNGGTCQQAPDKASYFCRCLPTFTGWRCESQVLVATSSTTPLTTTQVLVNSTTKLPPFIDFDTMFFYIGIALFILICLLAILFAGQAVYFRFARKDEDGNDSVALLDRARLKLWSKPKHRHKKPPQRKDTLTGESVKGTHIKRTDTLTGESVKGTHIKRKDTQTGDSVKGRRLHRRDTVSADSFSAMRPRRKSTQTVGESFRPTRPHRKNTVSGESVRAQRKNTLSGESIPGTRPLRRKDTQNTLTSVRSLRPLRTATGCSIETTTSRSIRRSRDFTESEKTLVRKKSKPKH